MKNYENHLLSTIWRNNGIFKAWFDLLYRYFVSTTIAHRDTIIIIDHDRVLTIGIFEPFKDRVKVYQILNDNKIETPRYIVCDRSDLENMPEFEEFDDYLEINGETFHKPFVEKPVRYDQN